MTLSSLSDESLIALSLGERIPESPEDICPNDAFECLVERHLPSLRRMVYSVLGSPTDVDDVVQSALLKAYRSLDRLENRSRFKYWIRMIALNEARTLTGGRHRYDLSLEQLLILPEKEESRPPERAVETSWLVRELFERLPEQYMTVLYLRYYLEYSVQEVADALGIEPGLVKWRANRGKKLASDLLSEIDNKDH